MGSATLYTQLDTNKRQIRLVRIAEGSQAGHIELELAAHSLDNESEYKALSYCWTTAEPDHRISVNGQPFMVRPSLYAWLEHMSTDCGHGWIFIDAICVSQDDVAEKSSQVVLMGDVYCYASEVIAWLTPTEVIVYGAIDVTIDEELIRLNDRLSAVAEESDRNVLVRQFINEVAHDKFTFTEMLYALANSPYWDRLWVIQELLLADKLTFRFQALRIAWRDLAMLLKESYMNRDANGLNPLISLMTLGIWDDSGAPTLRGAKILAILDLKRDFQHRARRRAMPFNVAMSICAAQKCVRVHDKLYGLLGMGSIKLDVDYDLPINRMHACALIEMTTNRPRYHDLKGSASLDDFRPYGAEAAESLGLWTIMLASGKVAERFDDSIRHTGLRDVKDGMSGTHSRSIVEVACFFVHSSRALHRVVDWTRKLRGLGKRKLTGKYAYIEEEFMLALERKYAGVTEIAAISEILTRLASLSKAETYDLVLRIVRFPTKRERDELVRSFKRAVRKLDQSPGLSPHQHVSRRVLLASLSKGLEDEEEALHEHLREKIEQEIEDRRDQQREKELPEHAHLT
ncbi:hypothetical protein LTR48_003247 [Friedmanniomyces endolithicus]|uniref:Heterokaryon incompatibility domain-containing protein n=1 Tax=Rachicladosporium monterosium TaxID=1507873 RepID=A0ABR0L8S8_9PEZI|nr:hypothetical protein LTR48_003247 [Friedmanniomyces endolithicus]KAK5145199.1 hypothetical protein LTR32_003007 [Rachicladosporium monterosium]